MVCGSFAYVLIFRRHLWLRLLDAEESFWARFGVKKGGFGRGFGESRFFTISFAVFSILFLIGAVLSAVMYLRFR